MLKSVEKTTLSQAQEASQTPLYPATWLGEVLRQILLFPLMHIFVSIKTINVGKLVSGEAYIFAANHSSHLDAPVVLAALPLRLRMRLSIAAAADYFFARRWRGLLAALILNAFPFERKRAGCGASLAYSARLLRQGRSLLIFPEGTRSKDGHVHNFKRGIGQIARQSMISVVPTWIDGTFAALPKGARWPHRQAVIIKFGTPLHFTHKDAPASIAAAVECAVRALGQQM